MEDIAIPVPNGEISGWYRRAAGNAPTVVLVHGLSGNSRWWGSVIEHLPGDLGALALDVRGRGESVDAPPPFDLGTIADDVVRAMDRVGVERAVVAGYSMGGWVVAMLGVRHPDRVARLLLVDGGLPLPRDPDVDAEDLIEALVGPSLQRLRTEFEDEESFFDAWKTHPAFASHWDGSMRDALGHELVSEDDHFVVRANPEAIEAGARELAVGTEANQAAEKLAVPSHLIVVERGTTDQPGGMIPHDVARAAAATNHRLTMQYLPDLNHYTLILGAGAPAVAAAIAGSS